MPGVCLPVCILLTVTVNVFSVPSQNNQWSSFSGDKTIEKQVESLLSKMTLDEKIGQMTQITSRWDTTGPVSSNDFQPSLKKGLIGSVFNAATAEGTRKLQEFALSESRLNIPLLFGYDVIHGYRTIFPIPLAESCSWDLQMMENNARIAAREASSEGIHWTFAPMVDIARDPRWGRVMEGSGEDIFLGSLIAKARVRGFQGGSDWQNLRDTSTILACAKHYAAYGAAEAGRDYNSAELSLRTLKEFYLPPYKAAKDAGVATFMTAFNEIGGVPCTASRYLLTDVLRQEWGFTGFVVTDYTAINELIEHGVAENEEKAGELALLAGVDMDMNGGVFLHHLKDSVDKGTVPLAAIDTAVRRILEMKFLLGLFDDPFRYSDKEREQMTVGNKTFITAARHAAQRSIVLLKNENNVFPLADDKILTVALIGPMIKDRHSLNGEWAARGNRQQSVTLFEGLTERYSKSNIKFLYAKGCDLKTADKSGFEEALAVARKADLVLAAVGEEYHLSGEAASRSEITLPGVQRDLLKELKKTGRQIGLVLLNGRPLDLSWENENVDAILEAWYPGTMAGHAIADVIAGDYNPSAKLTLSFPRSVGQIPVYYNHKNTGRPVSKNNPKADYKSFYMDIPNSPLYPFGHGLSYTSFQIGNVNLNTPAFSKGETLKVSAEITNTGTRPGEEVVQLYVRDIHGSVTRPMKELKGFKKVALEPGQVKSVEFALTAEDLAFYTSDMTFKPEPGKFTVWVASSSEDEANEISFNFE